ncbi:MAG: hypothetical protein L0Y72_30945 [Gemmataceae bacterium]|nr:hypothetical protein [Gemmataceae bacterium]MCI0743467.1 hypothetical protein [Gemmataceae bacterium]
MARVSCQVIHRPGRVTFVWSDARGFFEPYHLAGDELTQFYEVAQLARQLLARIAAGQEGGALDLARAGHQLYGRIFRQDAHDPQTREIEQWLHDLYNRSEVNALEFLQDAPGRIPWNVVYGATPDEAKLRSGDPAAFQPFWGVQYPLAAGRRVNPLRVGSVLEDPVIVVAADAELLDNLPGSQRSALRDWANGRGVAFFDFADGLRSQLREQAPDILYLFGRVERGRLVFGRDRIAAEEVRDLLTEAKVGNPDPVVFLQACGGPEQWDTWECFVASWTHALCGIVASDVPLPPALADALGFEALTQFLQPKQRLGQAVKEARGKSELAGLAYALFCPPHVKIAQPDDAEPDVPPPSLLALPAEPYRPLAPFDSEDRALFTGREDDTVRCASALDEAGTRGLILHGPPGVGKTSLVRAGLVPYLENEAVGYAAWRDRSAEDNAGVEKNYPVVAVRPGSDLAGQIAQALCALCARPYTYTTPAGRSVRVPLPEILAASVRGGTATTDTAIRESTDQVQAGPPSADSKGPPMLQTADIEPVDLWESLQQDEEALARLLDGLTKSLPVDLVMVLEQGEDLVLQVNSREAAQRRGKALALLGHLFRSPARCKVVLAMRTEYLGRLAEHAPMHVAWRSFGLRPLTESQLTRAFLLPTANEPAPGSDEIPFENYRFTFEDGLAKDIVKDSVAAARERQMSPLAILQAVGAGLHEGQKKRGAAPVKPVDYRDLGKAEGALATLVDARLRALSLPAADLQALRGLFAKLYARKMGGALVRELVPVSELAQDWKSPTPLDSVLDKAADQGLLEINHLLINGEIEPHVSFPQESLAQVARQWDEDRQRAQVGRTKMIDTLWIMIPLLFLVGALTWFVTRRSSAVTPNDTEENKDDPAQLAKALDQQVQLNRWPMYIGAVSRAEQAFLAGNPLKARQLLLTQQPVGKEVDLRSFEWYYLWQKVHPERHHFIGHRGQITAVAISPDGKIAASASMDGTIKLWNLEKDEESAVLKGHEGPVHALAFAPGGKTLASAGEDKTVRLWDASAGGDKYAVVEKELKKLTGHSGAVSALAFGKDSNVLVSAGKNQLVIVWNVEKGKEASILKEHTAPVQALAVAPDGKTFASAAGDTILVREADKVTQTIKAPAQVTALAFGPDGKTLASATTELPLQIEVGTIRFWDAASGKETRTPLKHASGVFALASDPSRKVLASAGKDNSVRFWDIAGGKQVGEIPGHFGWVSALAFSADGAQLVTGSYDASVKVWNGPGATPLEAVPAHPEAGLAMAYSADSRLVASGGREGAIKIWDARSGRLLSMTMGPGPLAALAFSTKAKTRQLAASFWGDKKPGEIHLWDLVDAAKQTVDFKQLPGLSGHSKTVLCLAYAPDGSRLAAGDADGIGILWDVAAGKPAQTLKGHSGGIRSLGFSQDGKFLLTAGADRGLRMWNPATGSEVRRTPEAHSAPINGCGFFLESAGFLSAGDDQLIRFWVAEAQEAPGVVRHLRPHGGPITCLAIQQARDFFLTGSTDGSIKLVDLRLQREKEKLALSFGEERFTFNGHKGAVRALAIAPDGESFASLGEDGMLRFWRRMSPVEWQKRK